MYQKRVLGLEEASVATEAVLAAAREQGVAVTVAVVDEHGDLVQFARMNGASAASITSALNKAYTAAWVRSDTAVYKQALRAQGETLPPGDDRRTAIGGGLCIGRSVDPSTNCLVVLGAIGVAGLKEHEDELFAQIGRDAIGT